MDARMLKGTIAAELPREAFQPQPWRALFAIPLLLVVATGTWVLYRYAPPWYLSLLLALVVGNAYGTLGFLAHEALHGAIFRSTRAQDLMGYLGFSIFFISPHLWRVWHNQVHHGFTNLGNRDPDSFGTVERYWRSASTRFVARLGPGSGYWLSYLFLFYWFTFHAQVVLWIQSTSAKAFLVFKLDRRRAIVDSALMVTGWVGLSYLLGARAALYALWLPTAVANFVVMSYIATNHFLRPQSEGYDPVNDSMSVDTHPLIDVLHLNFSRHVEHHLFPAMSPRFAPQVRAVLQRYVGAAYVSPPHWKALWYLYQTPRIYLDADTLVCPDSGRTVPVPTVEAKLRVLTEV